jgi:hypothetical protein
MKISNDTLAVLKNFASINTNIVVREGSVLATVSEGKNILTLATVAESFPREFAVYDLNNLLALLSIWDDHDIEFEEASMFLRKDGQEFEYGYADPSVVTSAPYKSLEIDPFFTFTLTAADVSMVQKASSILSAPTMSVVSKDGKITLSVSDPSNPRANAYRKELSTSSDVGDFDARLKVENLKVIPDSYEVSIGRKKAMHLKNTSKQLEYWLALEPASVV